jgi:hypothetical protein
MLKILNKLMEPNTETIPTKEDFYEFATKWYINRLLDAIKSQIENNK